MSENSEKVLGVKSLPIFPLPIVLLPGEFLPLHIFEPRYRQMLDDIKLEKNLFGLSFFNPANSESSKPEIGSVGCVAEVRETETLEDGRSNIVTIGVIRYRIEDYVEADEPYLIAKVSFFEDDEEDEMVIKPLQDKVFELFVRISDAAHALTNERGKSPELRQLPGEQLSFLIAAAFGFNAEEKYEFLQIRSTSARLSQLLEVMHQAIKRLEENVNLDKAAKTNGHSKRKPDLN